MNLVCPEPIFVDSTSKLEAAAEQWQSAPVLAIDTEFMRTNTFYPYLGLIQLSDGQQSWLIDPLAEMDLDLVKQVLVNPKILKVIHSCSEDLEVLTLAFEILPKPLVDTQIAAAIAGIGFGMGYNKLLNQMLDINLDKHETRSDWLQRPLSPQQLLYAAEDVYFLYHLYPLIEAQLNKLGRFGWLEEDMTRLLDNAEKPAKPSEYYLRIKSAWRLPREKLAVLQQLCTWRENEAMLRNKPRGHIIKDDQLLQIVQQNPVSKDGLAKAGSLHPGTMRRYADTLLGIIDEPLSNSELPPAIQPPLDKNQRGLVKQVKSTLAEIADQHQFPQEIIAAKRDIEQLIRHGLDENKPMPEKFIKGWRVNLVVNPIFNIVKQHSVL